MIKHLFSILLFMCLLTPGHASQSDIKYITPPMFFSMFIAPNGAPVILPTYDGMTLDNDHFHWLVAALQNDRETRIALGIAMARIAADEI